MGIGKERLLRHLVNSLRTAKNIIVVMNENIPQYFPRPSINKNSNTLESNILRQKIDGGQGGIRSLDSLIISYLQLIH